jgi:hypothetical protein
MGWYFNDRIGELSAQIAQMDHELADADMTVGCLLTVVVILLVILVGLGVSMLEILRSAGII